MKNDTKWNHPSASSRGFSLSETLMVVATLAIIASIVVTFIGNARSSLTGAKLEQDVARLNTSIEMFLGSGGSLSGIETAQGVLTELKRAAANEMSVVGLRGSAVDLRLRAVEESGADRRARAIWNADLAKFTIADSDSGVREFVLDDTLAGVDYTDIPRNTPLVYNPAGGWVWLTRDFDLAASSGPRPIPTAAAAPIGGRAGVAPPDGARLQPPIISPGSGSLALTEFPLLVSIAPHPDNPEDAGIYYSTEPGSWTLYTEPFPVDAGTHVQAYSVHEDPAWGESERSGAYYINAAESLSLEVTVPKNPITYAEAGGALEAGDYTAPAPLAPITVSLDPNLDLPEALLNSDHFQVYWTYDGSDPLSSSTRHEGADFAAGYSGDAIDYSLPKWGGTALLPIMIVAQSKDPSLVTNSAVAAVRIGIEPTALRAPVIVSDGEEAERGQVVEISKLVDHGDMPVGARIYYTTDGTDPGDDGKGNPLRGSLYTGPFDPLVGDESAIGATIVARIYPPEEYAAWFDVSASSMTNYSIRGWEISGTASGWFSNPVGEGGLLSNLSGAEQDSYFQWGDPKDYGTGANWLDFSGAEYTEVSAGERFRVGSLSYYNGTISMDSAATGIDFAVQLDFGGTPVQFDYQFELLTTANTGDAVESADFVWFNDPNVDSLSVGTQSAQTINLYGTDYSLNLEFGDTSEFGFSSVDQFHVMENRSSSASLYATLISLESWW